MATFIEEIGNIINSNFSIEQKYHAIEKCYKKFLADIEQKDINKKNELNFKIKKEDL